MVYPSAYPSVYPSVCLSVSVCLTLSLISLVYTYYVCVCVSRLLDDKELDCALSHGMVLSLHLFKLLKSSRRFANLFLTKQDSFKIIRCLQPIQAEFNVRKGMFELRIS